jgi:hypothetical protein
MAKRYKQPELPANIAPILEAFLKHGVGKPLPLVQLRKMLPADLGNQEELPRRIRDLRARRYPIRYQKRGNSYTLLSEEPVGKKADIEPISGRLSAQIRLIAHGVCQMCGKTIAEDQIKLVVDHRVPRDWGGATEADNLWAICEPCNIAKQAFFSTLPKSVMEKCMTPKDPTVRIGELLKAFEGKTCPRSLLEVVGQDDEWTRRLRELRDLGWKVETSSDPNGKGRYRVGYKLIKSLPWPNDVRAAISAAAKKRGAKSFK